MDDLAKELNSHIKYYNDKKVVNFDIKFGKDSGKPYAEWDNWEPQSQSTQETIAKHQQSQNYNSDDDELAF